MYLCRQTEDRPCSYLLEEENKEEEVMAKKKRKTPSLSIKRGEKLPASKGAGLTAKGRAKINRATGSKLKAPQPGGGKRKKSYCARSAGQMKMHGINCSKTPKKRICAARRRWKC
jgi:hypothetical protein